MARRFARMNPGSAPLGPAYSVVPSGGMCLSAFVVLSPPGEPKRVLVGRVAPDPRWEEIGALDPERAARFANHWMLPATQLLLFESPGEAARRIGRELLGLELTDLSGPQVFSEAYRRPESTAEDPHWDLHFVFRGTGPRTPPAHPLWRELTYLSVGETDRAGFARNHGDVLELAGWVPRDPPHRS
ncbi:MAG TPA: hypothetical protein VMI55_03895 [Thermoplasmata archaeon]|nr:hypothetical protein [Thermoplasmata archaeon]